jgi:Uma2 family endonuclease
MSLANTRLFNRDEYYRMAESGVFGKTERVELIEGEVVHVPPQNYRHSGSITKVTMVLTRKFQETHVVRVQCPLALGPMSEPEPDFVLISIADFEKTLQEESHPLWAPLVIEVAHTSIYFDRKDKCGLYARYQIPEYWIVNLPKQRLEVYRQPEPSEGAIFGHDYGVRLIFNKGQEVAPLFSPTQAILVEQLLA